MENKGLLLVLCIYYSIGKGDVAMDSKFKEEPLHETVSLQSGNRNSSYFVNPKQFLTYAEQFDKIKSLGAEVRCKLRGSCSNKKRSKISKKRTRTTKKFTTGRLVDKKSFEFRPSSDLPDNHNSILSPDSLSSPLSNSLLPPGVGSEYTQQPGAAVYGQQPQMNLKLPHSMDHSMGSQGSQTLDQVQNAENEASIQNSIKAKMDFMDRANGPQLAGGVETSRDLAPGGTPEGLPGDMIGAQHKAENAVSIKRTIVIKNSEISDFNPSSNTKTITMKHAFPVRRWLTFQGSDSSKSFRNISQLEVSNVKNSKLTNYAIIKSSVRSDSKPVLQNATKGYTKRLLIIPDIISLDNITKTKGNTSFRSALSQKVYIKEGNGTKKSLRSLRRTIDLNYKANELPPIYLTVKNGEKVLVVHPTVEFLQSLPRINFTDPVDKRPVTGRVSSSENNDGNSESELYSKSNVAYLSIPVISPDPEGPLNHWLRSVRDQIARKDDAKNYNDIRSTPSQLGNIYSAEEYLRGERKSETTLPVPREIQNLYKKFHPKHSSANFQYIPSRAEVAEELEYAQQTVGLNRQLDENNSELASQNIQGELQRPQERKYEMGSQLSETATSLPYSEPWTEGKYKVLLSDERKRSKNPLDAWH